MHDHDVRTSAGPSFVSVACWHRLRGSMCSERGFVWWESDWRSTRGCFVEVGWVFGQLLISFKWGVLATVPWQFTLFGMSNAAEYYICILVVQGGGRGIATHSEPSNVGGRFAEIYKASSGRLSDRARTFPPVLLVWNGALLLRGRRCLRVLCCTKASFVQHAIWYYCFSIFVSGRSFRVSLQKALQKARTSHRRARPCCRSAVMEGVGFRYS